MARLIAGTIAQLMGDGETFESAYVLVTDEIPYGLECRRMKLMVISALTHIARAE